MIGINIYKIYKYTFPNGKIYIGMTKNSIQYRKDCGYQHNIQLRDAIRNFGWKNISVEILEVTKKHFPDETEVNNNGIRKIRS